MHGVLLMLNLNHKLQMLEKVEKITRLFMQVPFDRYKQYETCVGALTTPSVPMPEKVKDRVMFLGHVSFYRHNSFRELLLINVFS